MDTAINFLEGIELDGEENPLKLHTIRYMVRAVFPMLVQLGMVFKAKQLQLLLEDILSHVSITDKIKLKKISLVSVIAVYFTIVIIIGYRIYLFVFVSEDEQTTKAIGLFFDVATLQWYHRVFYFYLDLIHRPLFEQQWIQVSAILYSVYMLALYYAEMSLTVDESKMADKGYLRAMAARKASLIELNCRLNCHLSWLPLLWYAKIFLQSCGLIVAPGRRLQRSSKCPPVDSVHL
ncbi:hypothetical protein HDE_04221 [Halotydeus destructor]|nr:hypothetical protein HDE_04221 [Halotydeus destructor]